MCAYYARYKKSGKGTTFFADMQVFKVKVCLSSDFFKLCVQRSLLFRCSMYMQLAHARGVGEILMVKRFDCYFLLIGSALGLPIASRIEVSAWIFCIR